MRNVVQALVWESVSNYVVLEMRTCLRMRNRMEFDFET